MRNKKSKKAGFSVKLFTEKKFRLDPKKEVNQRMKSQNPGFVRIQHRAEAEGSSRKPWEITGLFKAE